MEELTMILLAILMFCLSFYIIATQVRTYKRSKHMLMQHNPLPANVRLEQK